MPALKRWGLRLLTLPVVRAGFAGLMRDRAAIFMLHRIRDREGLVEGVDPEALRAGLGYLRREGYELLPLGELLGRLAEGGNALHRAVSFTLDDGYRDQARVAARLFAEFDCPATTFVATGFLDGKLWFWWDRIEHAFRNTQRRELAIELGGRPLRYEWQDDAGRHWAQLTFTEQCKQVPETEKLDALSRLGAALEVEIPKDPPPPYRPMSWQDLREAEDLGMTFGPHTVTHPVLSRTSDAQCRSEIEESWRRLRAEAQRPLPVFCYPNGQSGDFGAREFGLLEELGMQAAVVGIPGYAESASVRGGGAQRFQIRRFSYPERLPNLIQYVSGIERFKQILRREGR